MDMLKHGVKWVTGTFVIIFCMWCYLICSNSVMFAYSYRLPSYANVSRSWKFDLNSFDGKPILYSKGNHRYPPFSFGFHSLSSDYSCYFILAIYIRPYDNDDPPAVVWCANQIEVVCDNDDAPAVVTLDFTSHGDLVLRDMYGSSVWSSNTSGRSVKSMHLRHDGNLVLSNGRGEPIWESFNYPTDTLLFNQVHPKIPKGQRLVSRNTSSDYSLGIYYASWDFDGIHGFINSDPPKQYGFVSYDDLQYPPDGFEYVCNLSCHYPYMRLDELGRLRWYRWNQREFLLGDVFSNSDPWDDCGYPTTCGRYGVCTNFSRCVCPASDDSWNYFKPNEAFNAESGCTLVTPLSCPDSHKLHTLIKFENLTYFDHTPSLIGTDVENCKIECLKTCSCKAVIFRYYDDFSSGNCTLPSEIFTLIDTSYLMEGSSLKRALFIKVQNRSKKAIKKRNLVVPISSSLTALVLVTGVCYYLFILRRRRAKSIDCSQDVFVDTVTRFSYESLVTATQDFQTRLGRGGFGSVFEGTLGDGTKVAVKRLDSLGQGRKEFLAEVNTIGSVHHFNLVKLIGFCDDGLNRLLVYEYMCNGSLEKWIFNQDVSRTLAWNLRRRIIDGVASGLEYLHEHCNQNIIHFDIKPQNILLDKDFNVKISDFGLAKMVDRDHSQVVTIVRGTPGYMAPELITGRAISCKVDVYSFGVLVLEIVCGRKNFGSSEADCLTNLVKMKADGDQLSDLIDEHGEDMMQQHKEEVVNMMKIAIWCLQPHFIRPTMSMVVKVLQDLANMEPITDLSYLNMVHEAAPPVEENFEFSIRPTESLLSGPR